MNDEKLEQGIGARYLVRATVWYVTHQKYVDRIISVATNKYPPTDEHDVMNPNVWKADHWKWFVEEYL